MFELFKNSKGQISVEVLTIVGILVIGGIIFGVFYLSQINRSIDDADQLDTSIGDQFGEVLTPVGMGNILPTCSDNIQNGLEQGVDCGGPCPSCVISGDDCGDGYCDVLGGECDTCPQDCTIDQCSTVPKPFEITLEPLQATGIVGQDYLGPETNLIMNNSTSVDLSLTVKKSNGIGGYSPTDECTYDGQPTNNGFIEIMNDITSDSLFKKNINCSQEDTYYFSFKGVDENSSEVFETFEFTIASNTNPPWGVGPSNNYSLCSTSALSGGSGTLRVCLNDYTTTLDLGGSDYLTIYVNQPDALENNCKLTSKGSKICVYVGNSWK